MIKIYKNTSNGLECLDEVAGGCWIKVVDPTPEEIDQLVSQGVLREFITYSLDVDEMPRTERDEGQVFILLRYPIFQGVKVDIPYFTMPLGIIHNDNFILTVCRHENDVLNDLISGRIKGVSTAKRNRFTLQILFNTANKFLMYLREMNKIIEALEDQLQASMKNKEVFELLKYQKSLVYFTTALKSNELMMERLQRSQLFRMFPDDEELLEDVITENQQAISTATIISDILVSMMDAFASIISNNLNVVMKFLASVTIVLSIPTILTSYFGMNVDLPFQFSNGHFVILGIIIGVCIAVVAIFVKRDWF